jgi:hypothetical protein
MKNTSDDGPDQPKATALPGTGDRFDIELVEWFASHGGEWSGTATELLAAIKAGGDVSKGLWPESAPALYAHLALREEAFLSLGVAFSLSNSHPRMISIHQSQEKQSETNPPSGGSNTKEPQAQDNGIVHPSANQAACDNIAELLIEMLRTSSPPAATMPSAIAKLRAASVHMSTAFKRAWRRPRAS